jgi:hypothetical protein
VWQAPRPRIEDSLPQWGKDATGRLALSHHDVMAANPSDYANREAPRGGELGKHRQVEGDDLRAEHIREDPNATDRTPP